MPSTSIGEIVRKQENEYTRGSTKISKYVEFSMHDTIENIDAYLNSKHLTGETDSLGRDKPFFNISVAAAKVWYRATDIDRSQIRIRATKATDWLDAFIATIHFRAWMRSENFGRYLNELGWTLAKYCSAVTKVVRNTKGLHVFIVPWNRIICDAVNFEANPQIEFDDLTEGELKKRVVTMGYDKDKVEALCEAAKTARKTIDEQQVDSKNDYIRIYEVHGVFPKSYLTGREEDASTYTQQMHVISFVTAKEKTDEYEDFTLFSGPEDKSPYRLSHLLKEDNRTLAIGPVELLFTPQWMTNHSMKSVKDTLDVISKIVLQTADAALVGRNILTDIENGEILITGPGQNQALSKVEMSKPELGQWSEYAVAWKTVGNELAGISESMLGAQPKSGTAWRQTEAILQESYSLFGEMTENKALYLEDLIRFDILPYIKETKMDTADEITATLEAHEIERIDSRYIKDRAVKEAGRKEIVRKLLDFDARGELPTQEGYDQELERTTMDIKEGLASLGGQRFFKPSEISEKTWQEQFENLENEVEIDIVGENQDIQSMLTSLNTALRLVVQPGFAENKKAQAIVGRVLELTGAMSPVEYESIPNPPPPRPVQQPPALSETQ